MEEWHRYYSEKRIGQQWKQLDLVGRYHRGGPILEVGPYLGLVTACLVNAGYAVSTLDLVPRRFAWPQTEHICADIRRLDPSQISGFRTILCCEMLEHLTWEDATLVLRLLHQAERTLILSVPYEGSQIFAQLYLNRHHARQMFQWRKLRAWRDFPAAPAAPVEEHQWEIGYRGRSLARWEEELRAAGWRILTREFTAPTRSVFHVLRGG